MTAHEALNHSWLRTHSEKSDSGKDINLSPVTPKEISVLQKEIPKLLLSYINNQDSGRIKESINSFDVDCSD